MWSLISEPVYDNFTQLWEHGGHPNTQRGSEEWAVRRWTSQVDGHIRITGEINDTNRGGGGNGITGRIFKNNEEIYSQLVDHSSQEGGYSYDINLNIEVGDTLDFAIDPNSSDGDDSARLLPKSQT